MHWVLHLGLETTTAAEDDLLDAVVELGLPHTLCKVIPFSYELVPEPDVAPGEKAVVYGGRGDDLHKGSSSATLQRIGTRDLEDLFGGRLFLLDKRTE